MRSLILKISFLFWMTLIIGCGSGKKASTPPPPPPSPDWVAAKPTMGMFYHGIGYSLKSANPQEYQQIAKKNALNDLSSEISVQISSTSMLYQMEQNDQFREEFKSNTRLKSLENLEGYELVDTYENDREYWVYYRLDKAQYEKLKQERIQQAVEKSKDLLAKAIEARQRDDHYQSLIFHIRALEAVGPYLGDPLRTTWKDQEVFLGNELNDQLLRTLSGIRVEARIPEVRIKRGQTPSGEELAFMIRDEDNHPVTRIPVFLYFSGGKLDQRNVSPNHLGEVQASIGRIVSNEPREYIQANLNLVQMVKEATEDPLVSSLIAKYNTPSGRITLVIERPSVYINSEEFDNGHIMKQRMVESAFIEEFLQAGIDIASNAKGADFILKIKTDTERGASGGKYASATLNGTIQLFDEKNNLIYADQITGVRGVQLDDGQAAADAYKKAADLVRKKIFLDMKRKVFD